MQEAVLERGALDLDVVGELEDALESARRDALIEHLAAVLLVLGCFSPLIVSVFSFASIESSFSPKPATATVMR